MKDGGAAHTVVAALAACAPLSVDADPELDRSLAFLGWCVGSARLRTAAVGAATLAAVIGGALALVAGPAPGAVVVFAGVIVGSALVGVPGWLATTRRTRALGAAPDIVGLAVLRTRVDPSPERAAAFAAEHGRGPLAASLRGHVTAARGTPAAGWGAFADAWGEWAPGLRRAASLVSAAASEAPKRRERLLDRAFRAILDGTRDRAARFAADLRGPTSALYAFGVVLPLALVAALPAVGGAGLPGILPVIVLTYDLALPLALGGAAAWLLARRPVAFPPAPVPRSHPDVPDRRLAAGAAAALAGAAAWGGCRLACPPWTVWLVAPAAAVGCALVVWYRPVCRVRESVDDVEAGLADALVIVGGRLQRGAAPEAAVAAAGREIDGPAGDLFALAARRGQQLGVGVRATFLGDAGVLATVPSARTRAAAELLALAGQEGAHGGRVLVELADHVDELRAVEREARNDLSATVGTLRNTGRFFAPLIGGATVAMAGQVGASDAVAAGGSTHGLAAVPAAPLGLAVGWYVLVLAAILAALATGLERGFDRTLVGYHVGIALLSASVVYPAAFVATGVLV